ncbi:acyloxyacyl hydrolase [Gilvibacter sediminis]|uniref:acyloxyacyl hydrolase n=1 Tax=Gilvibacter sediminis TaxID=379071 RepID=UPI00235047EE|nr:acyloxyacyl hydrolase [Gilvibacter sediminis]MDC7999163.1 acyloxyacyl hydrolase [Gilvibacter sediminis]
MRHFSCVFLFVFAFFTAFGQENESSWRTNARILNPEFLVGQTFESNSNFPNTGLQYQFVMNFGMNNANNPQQWAQRLKAPVTGLSLGLTNFGNRDSLGLAVSVIPYVHFRLFKNDKFTARVGMGGSYHTDKFDATKNPNNQAVTTDITWAFRTAFYYRFLQTTNTDWHFGINYSHHSNGHTRLLNQGYNSVLASVSVAFHEPEFELLAEGSLPTYDKSTQNYISIRYGQGFNVLALAINDQRSVYSFAGEFGRVYNNTFKLGIGFGYRLYKHYYDYIKNNESLVQDGREFDFFKEDPWRYASNFAITFNGEFLLNHIGLDLQLGVNLHKPGYQIDWRLNEGWDNTPREVPESWQLGEFNSKYQIKKLISSRLGLKYYFIGNEKSPRHNVFLGAHLQANLGQADFTEFSIGYVYQWKRKNSK